MVGDIGLDAFPERLIPSRIAKCLQTTAQVVVRQFGRQAVGVTIVQDETHDFGGLQVQPIDFRQRQSTLQHHAMRRVLERGARKGCATRPTDQLLEVQ